jgi:hypothetical protein
MEIIAKTTRTVMTALCLASAVVVAGSVVLAPVAYAKGKQADDPANHNAGDVSGKGKGGGKDDPAGHR